MISDFNEGKTICAIVDSDSLAKLEGTDHEIRELLALNDTLADIFRSVDRPCGRE